MIIFEKGELRNFGSFGNNLTTINFNRPGSTLVVGENLDNTSAGVTSNGTGKSTAFINLASYVLYDKPVSDIKVDELINNINKKNMFGAIEWSQNGNKYRVERTRKGGKSGRENNVKLFINGEDKTLGSVKSTDKKIEEILGLNYEMFVRIVIITADHTPFLDLPVTSHYQANQTDFIERLFNLTILSKKAEALKQTIKTTEDGLKTQRARIELLQKEHDRHVSQIESMQNRVKNWERNRTSEIEDIESELQQVVSVDDVAAEHKLHLEIEEKTRLIAKLEKQRKEVTKLITKHTKLRTTAEQELVHLNDDRCPYCTQEFKDSAEKKGLTLERLGTENELLEQLTGHLIDLEDEVEEHEKVLSELEARVTIKNIEELVEIINKSDVYKQKIVDLKAATNPFLEPLEELMSLELEEINYDDINHLTDLLNHQQFVLKLLTKKDSFVRKTLLTKNIPFLNARLHHYFSQLGLTHKVEFTHSLTAEISQFGRPLSFGSLSKGQKARVNLALSFAFRDVLETMHTPVNICVLDEALDVGLDASGVIAASKLMKNLARDRDLSLFIISHRSEEVAGVFDRTVVVQMQKGFSNIIQPSD